jgi:glycosyltransferase involved in cell wall biosynthesis
VSCSFINPIKQLWVAIGGISQFANSNSDLNVDWVHFGDGDLNAIVNSESKLPENLVITQRPYPGIQELRRYYLNTEINVFVNTSKSEGVPVALMEAASCGIPLIGPGIGGVPDIVRDGFNGFIMSPHATTNTLSDCIQKLFDLEFHSRSEFHRNSRQVWEQAFDARVTYLKFAKDLIDLQRLKGSAC